MLKLLFKPNYYFSLLASVLLLCTSNTYAQDKMVSEITFDHDNNLATFAFGADISWLSQQESWGTYYCNRAGKRADLMDILKEDFGINALRFRVWVNPNGGWSGKQDVINLCKRAHAKGFKIMISFHYSDTWADSGNQEIPAKWTDHSAEALAKNVYDHTRDVLSGLKAVGIIPGWVSIGNETKYGMLYETGRTNTTEGVMNFVKFINAGAKAVKEISPDIITIIHLSNGHDEATARKMFDNLEKYGANYDCLGFSCYPKWSHLDITNDTNIKTAVNTYLNVFKNLKARFKKPVVVMETGHYGTEPYDANRFFAEFIKALIADKELGCFYWEPEAFDNSGYNLGAWSSATHQGTIAMDAFKGVKFTKVSKYATTSVSRLDDRLIYSPQEPIEIKVLAKAGSTVTSISSVDFYLNNELYTTETKGLLNFYTVNIDSLKTGNYTFHAIATDNQGNTESTDTLSFLVGNMTVFQENGDGYEGVNDSTLKVSKTVTRYTGDGYIPASSSMKSSINWNAHFPEAGKYTAYVRYHSDIKRSMRLTIGEHTYTLVGNPTPSNRWGYVAKTFDIESPGTYNITMQGLTSKGFPDIDFIAFETSEGSSAVGYGNSTAINAVQKTKTQSGIIYDIQGRLHLEDAHLSSGIYIKDNKKFIVK